jgi:DNA-binding CsgD family transcriptional regulator
MPPIWQTWWFRSLLITAVALLLFFLHKLRIKKIRIRLKTEAEIEKIFERCKITLREKEIIGLILREKSNREIEDILYISMNTIKNHVTNIFKKLGVKNRAELIYFFKAIERESKR